MEAEREVNWNLPPGEVRGAREERQKLEAAKARDVNAAAAAEQTMANIDAHRRRDMERMGAVKTMPDPHEVPGFALPTEETVENMRRDFERVAQTPIDAGRPILNAYERLNDAQIAENVDSPDHYNAGSLECIDAIAIALGPEGFRAFCHGNAIKYAWRARHKDGFVQDMRKAVWYARMSTGDDPREDQ